MVIFNLGKGYRNIAFFLLYLQKKTMEKTKSILIIILIATIIILILINKCEKKAIPQTESDTIIISKVDSFIVNKIKPYKVIDTILIIDTIIKKIIDSANCVNMFLELNKKNIYARSEVDSNISITIIDTIFQNQLQGGKIIYSIKEKQINNYILKKYQLQGGLLISNNIIAPILDINYKNHTIGAGYDIFHKNIIFSYKFNIHKFK